MLASSHACLLLPACACLAVLLAVAAAPQTPWCISHMRVSLHACTYACCVLAGVACPTAAATAVACLAGWLAGQLPPGFMPACPLLQPCSPLLAGPAPAPPPPHSCPSWHADLAFLVITQSPDYHGCLHTVYVCSRRHQDEGIVCGRGRGRIQQPVWQAGLCFTAARQGVRRRPARAAALPAAGYVALASGSAPAWPACLPVHLPMPVIPGT